jgi:hypothetical protein
MPNSGCTVIKKKKRKEKSTMTHVLHCSEYPKEETKGRGHYFPPGKNLVDGQFIGYFQK